MTEEAEKKPIGYSLGPDYATAPKGFPDKPVFVAVYALTPEQEQLKQRIEETREALAALKKLVAELESRENGCKHPVFEDRDGFLYIHRHCLICGGHIDDI